MSDDLSAEVQRFAAGVVASAATHQRTGGALDYTEGSLAAIEELLAEASEFAAEMSEEQLRNLSRQFGCYVLEVGRRQFGGRYLWHPQHQQPVLVVGEPDYRVALLAWDKVQGRLSGDPADNIPFFYTGFAQRVRTATPGIDVLYV